MDLEPTTGRGTPPDRISGVPLARLSDSFENFDLKLNPKMQVAYDRCYGVATGMFWGALLAGDYGTGKTHLAVAAMNLYGIHRSYFWKVPDYLDWLRQKAFDEGIPLDTLTRSYRSSPFLLVLDDLGVENQTDWAHEQLYRVLDSRCDAKLPTILTTNQPPTRIDGRLQSRYADGLVVCRGEDVRRRQLEAKPVGGR